MTKKKNRGKTQSVRKRVLILCEGETEVRYFNGFKRDEELKSRLSSVRIEITQPENFSPRGLVREALLAKQTERRDQNPYDSVWVVFDRNGHAGIPDAIQMANANKIRVIFSVRCFEYWILLHYRPTTKSYSNCDELIGDLREVYIGYEKNLDHYENLKHMIGYAVANGKRVVTDAQIDLDRGIGLQDLSVYTNVHELVEYLVSL